MAADGPRSGTDGAAGAEGSGDGPPSAGALAGLAVVDLSEGVPGPFGARLLGDHGAEVVKVERRPGGDPARRLAPTYEVDGAPHSAAFDLLNWNKRGVALDLDDEADRAALHRLVAAADVVIEDLDPTDARRWGLTPAEMRQARPDLTVVSVSPFGRTGPWADRKGSDLVAQATSGLVQIAGTRGRPPIKRGLRQALYCAGLNVAYTAVLAHLGALRTGVGAHVDLSVRETLASELVVNLGYYAFTGAIQGRQPARVDAFSGVPLPTADGHVSLQWSPILPVSAYAGLFDDPRLAEDRFATVADRLRHADELDALLDGHLSQRSAADLFRDAVDRGLLVGFVQEARHLLSCPQLAERGALGPMRLRDGRDVQVPVELARLSRTRTTALRRPAPALGEHTGEVVAGATPRTPRPAVPGAAVARPCEGLRVVDLSYVFAVPYLASLLADMGADVVKVEAPHRLDQARIGFGPLFDNEPATDPWNRNATFQSLNRGKRAVSVDLSTVEGREVLEQLVAEADVLVENFTPRVLRGWGLGYERFAELNPRLIMLSNTGYGSTGPWSELRAQGTSLEATMGITRHSGYPGDRPMKVGQSYPDFIACWTGLLSVGAALVERERSGRGQWIDLGMYQLGPAVVPESLLGFQLDGVEPPMAGSEDLDALLSGVFPAAGGDRWLAVSLADAHDAARLARTLPEVADLLAADPALAREATRDGVRAALAAWSSSRDAGDAADELQARGVAAGAVLDARDLLRDPQLGHRGFYEAVDMGPELGWRPLIGRPYTWSPPDSSPRIDARAPWFGEHNDEVLGRLPGIDLDRLRRDGIVADAPTTDPGMVGADLGAMVGAGLLDEVDPGYRSVADRPPAARRDPVGSRA
ncbi:MAG: CaiB/BaiF CoA transferase family protein [Acidimicrobiia bacterium]